MSTEINNLRNYAKHGVLRLWGEALGAVPQVVLEVVGCRRSFGLLHLEWWSCVAYSV